MKNNCPIARLAIAGMFLSVSACNSKNALLIVRDAAVDQPAPLGGGGGAGIAGSGGSGGAGASSSADASANIGGNADAAVSGTGDAGAPLGTPKHSSDAATIDAGLCGNGWLDPGEECDDGNTVSGDGCSSQCKSECDWLCGMPVPGCTSCGRLRPACGNMILTLDEECDDGNVASGDGCSASCQVEPGWRCVVPGRLCVPICGDGRMVGWETCDDGNTVDGDGCAHNCLVEPCWDCSTGLCVRRSCGDGGQDAQEAGFRCGDGILSPGEECDDGDQNGVGYDVCTTRCTFGPFCGDGQVNGGWEQCDLGSRNGLDLGKDGCTFGCTKPHYCGDGIVDTSMGEECDLGDLNGVKLDSNSVPSDAGTVRCDVTCRLAIVI